MLDLTALQQVIRGLPDTWITEQNTRAANVARYRRYTDGNHDAKLTDEMRELLRSAVTESDSPFSDNLMHTVIGAMVDRLELQGVRSEGDKDANAWIDSVFDYSRLDGMQVALFEATIRDGDAFLMIEFSLDADLPRLVLEDAYDGTAGVLVWYASGSSDVMRAAIKVWALSADQLRVNVYYDDRVEKFWSPVSGTAASGSLIAWTGTDGATEQSVQYYGPDMGMPIIHFRNRAFRHYGKSEIAQAIPLQDALNRTLQSLIMNSEYAGFPVLVAKGFSPPTALKPGSIVTISGDAPLTRDQVADLTRLEAGSNAEFLATAQWLTSEIERVTQTPSPESAAPTASGEARKQAEIGLIGKIKRFQISAGNAFEDAIRKAATAQQLYGRKPPPAFDPTALRSQWTSPELRDDKGVVERALMLRDIVGDAEVLRMVAPVYGYSEQDINRILDEKADNDSMRISQLGSTLPAFQLTAGQEPAQAETTAVNEAEVTA